MNERDRLFLRHVLDAIAAIESFTIEGRADFMADLKTQSAVVRQIEIIGEAVRNLDAAVVASENGRPCSGVSISASFPMTSWSLTH